MILKFEQIKAITGGAARIEPCDELVRFYRFTEEEEILYSTTEFAEKTFSTAGVQMEFDTDGDFLIFETELQPATSRTYFSFDIFVNGVFKDCIKNFDDEIAASDYTTGDYKLGNFEKRMFLGDGTKRVRIVFPWSVAAGVSYMEIENASFVNPVKKTKQMLIYGDSITNGYDALYPSSAYSVKLAELLDAEAFNKAIGGEIFFPHLAACKSELEPDYITVAYGTNDWGRTSQTDFTQRCKEFFSHLVTNYPNAKIFALTPIWRKNFEEKREFGCFHDVAKIIENICSQFENIEVIPGWNLVPHDEKKFADLRIHPNDKGFEYYYNNLKNEFENIHEKI